MGIDTMSKVLVTATFENLEDLSVAERGHLPADQVRSLTIGDALVDTRASGLSMPKPLIEQLGLRPGCAGRARTSAGDITIQVYAAVRLTIQGRDCLSDVAELPDDYPILIGRIPLAQLDFVVDPVRQRLIGNPAHGGEPILELY